MPSLALSYLDDLSRVRITPADLPTDGVVSLERSANQVRWFPVRGGLDLTVDGSGDLVDGPVDDYEFAANRGNWWRVVPVDPPAGLLLTGTSGDYASTPDDPSLDITGDISLRAEVQHLTGSATPPQALVAKFAQTGGDELSYLLLMSAAGSGVPGLAWSTDGTGGGGELRTATEGLPLSGSPSNVGRVAVRADLDVDDDGDHTVTFYTAPTIGGPWTQLGEPVTQAGTTSIHAGTAPLGVGAADGGSQDLWPGSVIAAEVYDGSTLVANPDFSAQAHDAASFDDDQGLTWTVHGDAEIIGHPIVENSLTPTIQQIWLKSIRWPFLNRPVTITRAPAPSRSSRQGVFEVDGRSVPVVVQDKMSSPSWDLEIRTATLQEAHAVELALAAGGVFLVHTPPGCVIPGGYVVTGDVQWQPTLASARSPRRIFATTVRIVAVPGPDVVGGPMTWGEVEALYGSWAAVEAAFPAWADVLDSVASPDALVTL